MAYRIRTGIIMLMLAQGIPGCGGNQPLDRYASLGPSPVVASPGLTIESLSEAVGSTRGGARIVIHPTGFQLGSTVTFDRSTVSATFVARNGHIVSMTVDTPPHTAGVVDVVVTNVDGRTLTLSKGYTYVDPDSFNFNGSWWGLIEDGSDRALSFIVKDNRLVDATCYGSLENEIQPLPIPSPVPVIHGEFAFEGNDGIRFSGRMVTSEYAIGVMNFGACNGVTWRTSPRNSSLLE